MVPKNEPPGGPPLPAPYENPWGLLARDLAAVLASLRLQFQALWRRNREGDLPQPPLWPRDLAPLFWPGLLLVGLGLITALGLALAGFSHRPAVVLEVLGAEKAVPGLPELPGLQPAPVVPPAPTVAGNSVGSDAPESLVSLVGEQDSSKWILAAEADADAALLSLSLAASFTALTSELQQQLAQQWQERAHALGYSKLELTDRQGRPLGRQALVGSGMILLAPQHLS